MHIVELCGPTFGIAIACSCSAVMPDGLEWMLILALCKLLSSSRCSALPSGYYCCSLPNVPSFYGAPDPSSSIPKMRNTFADSSLAFCGDMADLAEEEEEDGVIAAVAAWEEENKKAL